MALSMDFHCDKDSAEVIKAVEQGNSIRDLAKLLFLDIPPVFVDLVVAVCYNISLFDGHVAFATLVVGILYVCNAVETLIMLLGLFSASLLAIRKISSGEASAGSFVTLGTFWATMTYPLEMIVWSHANITSIFIDAERLLQLLRTKPSILNLPGSNDLIVHFGKVEFCNVEFSYSSSGKKILNSISFEAIPGKMVAFVGEIGAGKSTILKLLCRFYDATGGSISIDNQDLRNVTLDSIWDALGVVPQDPCLFIQSILENIRYSRPDATDDQIFEACRRAAIHDNIMSFPDGYNTKVGERGVKLSGGELQRLAIARVLVKDPKIVILDEATSAMDSSTEARIQKAFDILRPGLTMFVVAHRLSTITDADVILFLKDGKIVEQGTHDE
ncbi:uncharacterized protein PV09_09376 [Verruconis gallopava]|uniref:ABC transporter domain-containing protein n=1 Tax=Verruconis gallopava TaxID=253628 RepID=A0A0D1YDS3_9PEZI|nr:uncharacterized protein PV09_09376 [Verruconis gallopava]KIV98886.1 hypothetical protein PV09_09376 [Verruconis gallopava]